LSGPITISGGTLWSQVSGTLSSNITVDLNTGGFLKAQPGTTLTLAGSLSGYPLDITGGGTVVLTGSANAVSIASGTTFQVGNGGTSGSLGSNSIINGLTLNSGTLIYDHSDNVSVPMFITGGGALVQAGSGTLFVATSSAAGSAIVSSGTMALIGSGSFSIGGGSSVTDNAVFDISGISGSSLSIGSLNGSGTVILGNKSLTLLNSGGAFSGTIGGSGGLNISMTGTQVLSGANTYTGTTTVDSGILQLGASASLASAAVNINSGGTVEFDGSFTPTNTTITINSGGTLLSRTAGTTPLAGSRVIMAGGLLDTDTSATGVSLGSIEGTGTINLNNNALTVGSLNTDTTLAAAVAGNSQLNKIGTGTLTLTGSNTYSRGGVSVNGGAVVLGATGSLNVDSLSIRTGGRFIAAASTSIGNLFFDSGTVAAAPGATLSFTNNVYFSGPGPLVFGSQTLTGTITLAAAGCCIPLNSTIEIAGGTVRDLTSPPSPLDGNGSLSFAAYTAQLFTVDAGATADFNDHSVRYSAQPSKGMNLRGAGQILLGTSASTEMQIRSTNFSGIISGAGRVTFLSNTSTHLLTGNNTYAGGTTINSGAILQVGAGGTVGSIGGNVIDNGALTFNRSDNITFGGVISGIGTLTQSGIGALTLSGTNTYTGATAVNSGTLNVTGGAAGSSVTVVSGATLTGTGKVGATSIVSGGTLNPGSSSAPGILSVNGNLTLASGANYLDAITPTAAGLTSVSGTASVNGIVIANFTSGTYVGQRYTILSAAGGISGTFSGLSGIPASLKAQLSYDANNVYLNLIPNTLAPLLSNATGNQHSVASAIDAAVAAGNVPAGGFAALYALSGPALNNALDQISGQVGPNVVNAVGQSFLSFLSMTAVGGSGETGNFAPGSAYGGADAPHRAQLGAGETRVWGAAYGGHAGLSGDSISGAAGLSSNNAGLIGGADIQVDDGLVAGVTLGLGRQWFRSGNGTGDSDDYMIGLYGRASVDAAYIAASFGYGWHQVKTLRTVTVSGTDVLQGKQNADDFGGRIEAGWRVALNDGYSVIPYGAFVGESFESPAYAETAISGASTFALSYGAQTTALGRSELGAHLDRDYVLDTGTLTADLRAAWAHQLDDQPFIQASFQGLAGSAFQVAGVHPARDTALLGVDLEVQNSSGLFFGVHGEGQFGVGTTLVEGLGNFGWRW